MIRRILKFFGSKRKRKSLSEKKVTKQVSSISDESDVSSASIEKSGAKAPYSEQRRGRRRKRKPTTIQQQRAFSGKGATAVKTWDISNFEVVPAEGKIRFHDLSLPLEIMHAIADLNFEYCTPIQAAALPESLKGSDMVGQAQTGTGKTAAFLITLFTNLLLSRASEDKRKSGGPRALILVPTRELVMQITKEANDLGKYCPLRVVSVFGGIDYQKQRNDITSKPVDIMVATPGRLLDFQWKGAVNLKNVEILVLDEADRMLDMGFIPDVRKIVLSTPPKEKRQTLFFSATLTSEVKHLASQWTKKAINVEIEPEQVAVDSVKQLVYLTTGDEKYNLLYNVITGNNLQRVMIFANRRDETRKLTNRLKRNGINCAMLSGEVPQKNRIRTLEDFRNGRIRVLVATDVAGRGIHVDDVSHVINYTLPFEPENYVHRIGRTGRAGASGTSISFACEEGSFYLPEIEEFLGQKFECIYPDAKLLVPAPRGTVNKDDKKKYVKRKSHSRFNHPKRRH